MISWTRRRFIVSAAATACTGCGGVVGPGGDDDGDLDPAATAPARLLPSDPPAPASSQPSTGVFGGVVPVGSLTALGPRLDAEGAVYVPEARAWLVRYPDDALGAAADTYDVVLHDGLRAGIVALYQKCPHLGCRVPFCASAQWFECPCHGSQYTAVGEHRAGPGPRGMDLFPLIVAGDEVSIVTGVVVPGLPVGTVVVDQPAAGPHCVQADEAH